MNLHGIVRGLITSVNPDVSVLWRVSTGYGNTPDFQQVPTYTDIPGTVVQLQATTSDDLKQIDAVNIQGVLKALYMYGDAQGVVRPMAKGGDLFVFNSTTWKVVQVIETWPDWCKVIICLQNP